MNRSWPGRGRSGLVARLCLITTPRRGTRTGPFLLTGVSEVTVAETALLGASLLGLLVNAEDGVSVALQ